jgi:hypothetical protein
MQATDLGALKPDFLVTKTLRCARCRKRLGRYEVGFYLGDVFPAFVDLTPIRLPHPMGIALQQQRPRPELFFMEEYDELDSWLEPDGPDRIETAGEIGPRYRWRCGCGAQPVWRGTALAERWSQRDSTEEV